MAEKTIEKNANRTEPAPIDAGQKDTQEPEEIVQSSPAAGKRSRKKPITPKDVDPHTIVAVRNGFQGKLIYVSKKTGEKFVWDGFGAEQTMEIGELRNARNSNKKYFIDNWFMFDDPWVADYIVMGQYYKFALPIDQFDSLFEKPVNEIEETVSKLSDGQKKSAAYRARQLIAQGSIDSNRVIKTLEKCLGVELVERS